MMEKSEVKRIGYIDSLRVLSIFAVVLLHVSASNFANYPIGGFSWCMTAFFEIISQWCVPVFVMISGALLLSKNRPVKILWRKNILRLCVAFVFWSLVYAFVLCIYLNPGLPKTEVLVAFLKGHYHLWFLLMLIGLYILVPVLKKICVTKTAMKYFLIVCFGYYFLVQLLSLLLELGSSSPLVSLINVLIEDLKTLNIGMGFAGYFVLGYYLKQYNFTKKVRGIIYGMGFLGAIVLFLLYLILSAHHGKTTLYYNNFSINVLFEAMAVFVFAKYNFKSNSFMTWVAKYCFGVYLVHALLIHIVEKLLSGAVLPWAAIAIPIEASVIFVASLLLTWLISKIPVLVKYIT